MLDVGHKTPSNMHTPDDIDPILQIEALLGCDLPPDYRDWLRDPESHNPVPARTIVQADPPYEESVTSIYPLQDVLRYVDMEKDMIAVGSGDFPSGMIAIGDNGMGDYVLLSLRQADRGSVHYLFHGESNPDEQLWGLYLLGDSFSWWLSRLVRDEDESTDNSRTEIDQVTGAESTQTTPKPWWRFW